MAKAGLQRPSRVGAGGRKGRDDDDTCPAQRAAVPCMAQRRLGTITPCSSAYSVTRWPIPPTLPSVWLPPGVSWRSVQSDAKCHDPLAEAPLSPAPGSWHPGPRSFPAHWGDRKPAFNSTPLPHSRGGEK